MRCVQTAEALRAGASVEIPIVVDRLLGDPGVFVVDEKVAWANWEERGHEGVMAHLVSGHEPLPGMAAPDPRRAFWFTTCSPQPGRIPDFISSSLTTLS